MEKEEENRKLSLTLKRLKNFLKKIFRKRTSTHESGHHDHADDDNVHNNLKFEESKDENIVPYNDDPPPFSSTFDKIKEATGTFTRALIQKSRFYRLQEEDSEEQPWFGANEGPRVKGTKEKILDSIKNFISIIFRKLVLIGPPLKKLNKNIFAVAYRPYVHSIFLFLIVASTSYYVGKLLTLYLVGPFEKPLPYGGITASSMSEDELMKGIDTFKMANLFHAKLMNDEEMKKVVIDENIICTEATNGSVLPVKLLNTIVLQNALKSIAALQVEGDGELKSLRESDKIPGMLTIGKIERLKIIVKNLQNGQCEFIANQDFGLMSGGPSLNVLSPKEGQKLLKTHMDGIKNEGDRYTISRKIINEKIQDIDGILSQAKAIQMPNPDGSLSFKITEIVPGSIYSFLGIEENDKILKINGKKIAGLNEVMGIFGNIQNVDQMQLTLIKEDGNERTLDYSFSK